MNNFLLITISVIIGGIIAWFINYVLYGREEYEEDDEEYEEDISDYVTKTELEGLRLELLEIIKKRISPIVTKYNKEFSNIEEDLNTSSIKRTGIMGLGGKNRTNQ